MRLQTELNIANNEIKNLNAINTELNKKNQEQEKIIELYKTINVDELNPSKVLTNSCMSTPLGNQSEKVKRYHSGKKEFPLAEDCNKKHIATIPIHENKRDFTSRNNIIDTSKPINYTEKHTFNTKPNICIISGISNHKQIFNNKRQYDGAERRILSLSHTRWRHRPTVTWVAGEAS
ncbi:unnamed protein product [Parnassius apollo]|uniref:(apollo) hypothetical protein n=1 Tax=Parnassius apollo TaxID=110799 RepID=A0A8S3X5L8_PARAO|nr:unnamed protein product [Parnassius apollo]